MSAETDEPKRLRLWASLATFYVALFVVLGVLMQFFPLWLAQARSLSAAEVTWVWSAQTVARTFAGPLWAQHVDRTGRPRRTLMLLSLGSLFAFGGFGLATSLPALAICCFLFGCFYPPMHAIQDALAIGTAQRAGFSYGRVRVCGSLAFLATVLAVGYWLDSAPIETVFGIMATGLAVLLLTSFVLPADERQPRLPERSSNAPIGELLRSRPFVMLLLASALIQGSHGVYYILSTIHWRNHGISESTAGVLWGEAVLAEIVLFFVARDSFDRLRPTTMIMIGGLGACVRWVALGATTSVGWLLVVNWLHAFSFGCTYLGALRALERRVPPWQRATAQGLLGAASSGVGIVLGSLLGGLVYERFLGGAFFVMAGLAVLGAAMALRLRLLGIPDTMQDHTTAPSNKA